MERNNRRVREGIVISKKMDKTAVVQVERVFRHPKYFKTVRELKKFLVHDEENKTTIGDKVKIVETRPLSKRKTHRILEIIGKTDVKLRDLPKKSEKGKEKESLSDTAAI